MILPVGTGGQASFVARAGEWRVPEGLNSGGAPLTISPPAHSPEASSQWLLQERAVGRLAGNPQSRAVARKVTPAVSFRNILSEIDICLYCETVAR